jgi:hypothetical protein
MSIEKLVIRSSGTTLTLALFYRFYHPWIVLPIVRGYGAKALCSCVLLNGRVPQDVIDNEPAGGLIFALLF